MSINFDIFIPKGSIPSGTTMKVLCRSIFKDHTNNIESDIPDLCTVLDGPLKESEVFDKYSNDSNVVKPKSKKKASIHVDIFSIDLTVYICKFYQNPHLKGNYSPTTDSYCLVLIGDKKGWFSSHLLGEVGKELFV